MNPAASARRRPAVIAHRGGNGGPENSLEAVRSAIEAGADGVEIDIQIGPGGLPLARHDLPDPSRTGAVQEAGAALPLSVLLAVIQESGIALLIDFKSAGEPAGEAAALASALEGVERAGLITVSSFSVPFLDRFGGLAPGFDLVPIVSLRQNFPSPGRRRRWAGTSVLAAALLVNPLLLIALRRRRGRLLVWFAAMEWSPVVRVAAWLGAEAVIVSEVGRTLETLRTSR